MSNVLRTIWSRLQASFWFIPLLLILLGIGLAVGFVLLDHKLEYSPEGYLYLFSSSGAESARTILSSIGGAMIGVAGTVFSITLVALTLASSQFGPRLLQNFMYSKLNQTVLGSYVATFLYCLLVLIAIKPEGPDEFVPHLSVFFAIGLAVLNIFLLIIFIHQISMNIQADKVVADVEQSLLNRIKKRFPSLPQNYQKEDLEKSQTVFSQQIKFYSHFSLLKSKKNGYIQSIDTTKLLKIATEKEALITIDFREGEYMVEGATLGTIYSKTAPEPEWEEMVQDSFVVGKLRNATQVAEFAILQLVEVAVRALSPGVNDPFTAISCIDRLTSVLCYLTKAQFPRQYFYDEQEQMRLVQQPYDFNLLLDISFDQIREFASGSPMVLHHLMRSCNVLNEFVDSKSERIALRIHVDKIKRLGEESIQDVKDKEEIIHLYQQIVNTEE